MKNAEILHQNRKKMLKYCTKIDLKNAEILHQNRLKNAEILDQNRF